MILQTVRLRISSQQRVAKSLRVRAEPPSKKFPSPFPHEEGIYLALAIQSAHNICHATLDDSECGVAWDAVDEIIRGLHHRHEFDIDDPLEAFCALNPDADECRTYDV